MLSSSQVKELKLMIKNAKKKFPKSPRYSSKIQEMVGQLTEDFTTDQIYKDLGISKSFISKARKNHKVTKSKKDDAYQEDTPLQFIELPNEQNHSQPFVKLTSPKGLTIEIWG